VIGKIRGTLLLCRSRLGSIRRASLGCPGRNRGPRPAATPRPPDHRAQGARARMQGHDRHCDRDPYLPANLTQRLSFPRHLDRGRHPARMSRNAAIRCALVQRKIALGVTRRAGSLPRCHSWMGMAVVPAAPTLVCNHLKLSRLALRSGKEQIGNPRACSRYRSALFVKPSPPSNTGRTQ
jgi:hypothetical protein